MVERYVKFIKEGKPWSAFKIADELPAADVYFSFYTHLGILEVTYWIQYFHHSRLMTLVYEALEPETPLDRELWKEARFL